MARTSSKVRRAQRPSGASARPQPRRAQSGGQVGVKKLVHRVEIRIKSGWGKLQSARAQHLHLHKSFHRSYREDYQRPLRVPGLLAHAMLSFKTFFQYWRTFVPLVLLMTILYILGVGLMSVSTYQALGESIDATSLEVAGGQIGNFAKAGLILLSTITTGGLDSGMGEAQVLVTIILFLVMWLVTVFLLRRFLTGERPKLRDGLYNALGPIIPTLLIFIVIIIQAIPIMLVVIAYSAALATDFLTTPFYALIFFIFAALMLLLSGYLISSSLMALVAVTAPGMYPLRALAATADLMASRRIKFIIRLIYLLIVCVIYYIIVMLPIILLDLLLEAQWESFAAFPLVPLCLLIMTCFVVVYATIYIYLYYRWMLENDQEKA